MEMMTIVHVLSGKLSQKQQRLGGRLCSLVKSRKASCRKLELGFCSMNRS